MNDFWDGPADRRTCNACGHVIVRAGTIEVKAGKVRSTKPPAGRGKARGRAMSRPAKKKSASKGRSK